MGVGAFEIPLIRRSAPVLSFRCTPFREKAENFNPPIPPKQVLIFPFSPWKSGRVSHKHPCTCNWTEPVCTYHFFLHSIIVLIINLFCLEFSFYLRLFLYIFATFLIRECPFISDESYTHLYICDFIATLVASFICATEIIH